MRKNGTNFGKTQTSVFYLKVNSNTENALNCFWHWVEIVDAMGSSYYVVVDKEDVESDVRNMLHLRGGKAASGFMPSYREELGADYRMFISRTWLNVAYALMTPSVHARKNHIDYFWNIDADDTFFHETPQDRASLLLEAEEYAKSNGIDIFSFDMWYSYGSHWSFGISFSNKCDWAACVEKGIEWLRNAFGGDFNNKQYCTFYKYDLNVDLSSNGNLDFYFNFLTKYRILNAKCFYCENVLFEHLGHLITSHEKEVFKGMDHEGKEHLFYRGEGEVRLSQVMPLKQLSQFSDAFLERAFIQCFGVTPEGIAGIDNIILFGCGAKGGIALSLLRRVGANVACFCDNDPDLWGHICDGIPIINPAYLQGVDGMVIITVAKGDYRDEIKNQLESYGRPYLSVSNGQR